MDGFSQSTRHSRPVKRRSLSIKLHHHLPPSIAPKSPSCPDATKCMSGSFPLDSNDNPVDQGIWQSENGGASWTQISDSGIINCGDVSGCGVEQGFYNLALLAVPNGAATDLYAGAINLYKCSISSLNPTCATTPFLNLTHVYGCDPARRARPRSSRPARPRLYDSKFRFRPDVFRQ